VRYVDLNSANATPPYINWATAATNIQDAIDAAVDGDQVLVTNGLYATGGRVVFGVMTNRLVVDKAVTVQSVNGPAATTIAGFTSPAVFPPFGIRCVYLTNGAALIGFTLTNGCSRNAGDTLREKSGGGLWCEGAGAIASNCVFAGNSGTWFGGGAYRGTLINCTLTNNRAGFGGGAGVAYRVGTGSTRVFLEGKVTTVTVNGVSYVSIPIRVGVRFGANPRQ